MKPIILVVKESAAAAWATSDNVLEKDSIGQAIQNANIPRILRKIGFVGGAAALNTMLTIKVGNQVVAQIPNTDTTGFNNDEDTHELDAPVAPGEAIVANVSAASGTNPFYVYFEFDEAPEMKIARLSASAQAGRYAGYRRRY